jgi:hypothetical protein
VRICVRSRLGRTGIYEASLLRPMDGSAGFAHRMMTGSAAAHSAWVVACQSFVATHTGSAAATRARAYDAMAAFVFGLMFICGL